MGCICIELGEADWGVCVPLFRGHSFPVESVEGRSINFVDLPTLAGSAGFPTLMSMQYPSGLEAKPRAPEVGQGGDKPMTNIA